MKQTVIITVFTYWILDIIWLTGYFHILEWAELLEEERRILQLLSPTRAPKKPVVASSSWRIGFELLIQSQDESFSLVIINRRGIDHKCEEHIPCTHDVNWDEVSRYRDLSWKHDPFTILVATIVTIQLVEWGIWDAENRHDSEHLTACKVNNTSTNGDVALRTRA